MCTNNLELRLHPQVELARKRKTSSHLIIIAIHFIDILIARIFLPLAIVLAVCKFVCLSFTAPKYF